ncbi:hypothetical protein [Actinokineospora sp. HUAS TT18]|uniref:hypothetical protein n=1 Tax=Actinokineospora sp. HUAS TT18 TaxID=3447451 RepID=UPI003F521239
MSAGEVRATVLAIADAMPVEAAINISDEIARRATELEALLRTSTNTDALDAVRLLGAASEAVRVAAGSFASSAEACRAWASGV